MKTKKAKTNNNRPVQARIFSGLNDLTSWLETTIPDDGWNNHLTDELNFKFCGAHSYQEAKTDLLKGKNVKEIKRAIPKGNTARTTKKRGLDVIGGCPNVPAYLSGNPACMYRVKNERTMGAYNVFVDSSVHCRIQKSQVREAGIEILLRVLQLSAKYPVNLYVGDTGFYDNKYHCSMVKIVDAGKPFNIARISYALTEPAFLRVFGLSVIERNGGFWDKGARMGYGRPVNNYDDRKNIISQLIPNAVTISTLDVITYSYNAFSDIDAVLSKKR